MSCTLFTDLVNLAGTFVLLPKEGTQKKKTEQENAISRYCLYYLLIAVSQVQQLIK